MLFCLAEYISTNVYKTLKASTALLKHIHSESQRREASSIARNLLIADNEDPQDTEGQPLWLNLTAKKHLSDKARLKPGRIILPHSLHIAGSTTICLITTDPQRSVKDVIASPSFPASVASRITRVIGIKKLKLRYKTFESRRQLFSEHTIFLADDRIVTLLPKLLGKVFYSSSRRPVPINLTPPKEKGANGKPTPHARDSLAKVVASPKQIAREVERSLACTQVQISPSVSVSVRVGLSSFTASQVAENIEAVVEGLVSRFVPKGWRNVRSIHIKGTSTTPLPIWQAQELWVEATDVLEEEDAKAAQIRENQKGTKRKGEEEQGEDNPSKRQKLKGKDIKRKAQEHGEQNSHKRQKQKAEDTGMSTEMAERRQKLREQINAAKKATT